jgi:putative transposase
MSEGAAGGWMSGAEIARLLECDKSSVKRWALVERWNKRIVRRNGGETFEYEIASLPADRRSIIEPKIAAELPAICRKAGEHAGALLNLEDDLKALARQRRQEESLRLAQGLSAKAQARMDARAEMGDLVKRYAREKSLLITAAEQEFAVAYNSKAILGDAPIRALIPSVGAWTLGEWRRKRCKDGTVALAGSYGNRKGSSLIESQPEVLDLAVGTLASKPHCRGAHIKMMLDTRFGKREDIQLPSLRAIERWMDSWKEEHAEEFAALTNPDAWKNKYLTAYGSASDGIDGPNELWELDSTPADVMLKDGRHQVIGVIDVGTRRMKLRVSRTSKAAAIAALLRRALLDWGVPDVFKTDNGADYTSHHITRVFKLLERDHEVCDPFAPWQKPHIERGLKTFLHDMVELFDNFIGHNVAERKSIEARKAFADRLMKRGEVVDVDMTAEEFQDFCDKWCEVRYARRAHEGLGGRTPFEAAVNWKGRLQRIEDERVLDALLAAAPGNDGYRTVQKKGIREDNAWFICAELEVGRRVHVRYDETDNDLGRLFVFDADDMSFLCVAECPERTGMDRREVAIKARQLQAKRVQEKRAALKAIAKKVNTDDVVGEILRDRAERAGRLAMLPKPSDAHDSAGLRAAAAATQAGSVAKEIARNTGTVQPLDERSKEILADLESGKTSTVIPLPRARATTEESDFQRRFKRATEIEALLAAGAPVTEADARWLTRYQQTPEYVGQMKFLNSFAKPTTGESE